MAVVSGGGRWGRMCAGSQGVLYASEFVLYLFADLVDLADLAALVFQLLLQQHDEGLSGLMGPVLVEQVVDVDEDGPYVLHLALIHVRVDA